MIWILSQEPWEQGVDTHQSVAVSDTLLCINFDIESNVIKLSSTVLVLDGPNFQDRKMLTEVLMENY